MKKLTIIAATALLLTGCYTETYRDSAPSRTKAGQTLFGFANAVVSDIAMAVGEMEQLNTYIVSDDVDRKTMSDTEGWFTGRNIEVEDADSSMWNVSMGYTKMFAITMIDRKPLSEVGAVWSVKCETPYMVAKNRAFTAERISEDTLAVTLSEGWTRGDYPFEFKTVTLKFAYNSIYTHSLADGFSFSVSGTGTCRALGDKAMDMNFDAYRLVGRIQQENNYYPLSFRSGTLTVDATKNGDAQSVEASYLLSNQVVIRYKAIGETIYNNPINFYYYYRY